MTEEDWVQGSGVALFEVVMDPKTLVPSKALSRLSTTITFAGDEPLDQVDERQYSFRIID